MGNKTWIERAQLERYVVHGRRYHSPLPDGLEEYYCYTIDGGHSLIVMLQPKNVLPIDEELAKNTWFVFDATKSSRADDLLCPVPVKTVLRQGYEKRKVVPGADDQEREYLVANVDYDQLLGVVSDYDDDEYYG